ncbi:MAG: hypothetical protein KDK70_31370, partial [Myxococcales bacterium]|nr:hypothetical protein [Myxococcales bacterium]
MHRRRHRTALEIPSDLIVRHARSTPTRLGHETTVEPEPPPPPPSRPAVRSAPWTETVYVSPSGRIFLPPGFDFERGRPRTLTVTSVQRQPPPPRPEAYRARVVIGHVPSHATSHAPSPVLSPVPSPVF